MYLYRLENLNTGWGLWYNIDQSHSDVASRLELTNKDLPMGEDLKVSLGRWKSAADSIEQLKFWVTPEDVWKLKQAGFQLSQILVGYSLLHVTPHYSHPLFKEDAVIQRNVLSFDAIHE